MIFWKNYMDKFRLLNSKGEDLHLYDGIFNDNGKRNPYSVEFEHGDEFFGGCRDKELGTVTFMARFLSDGKNAAVSIKGKYGDNMFLIPADILQTACEKYWEGRDAFWKEKKEAYPDGFVPGKSEGNPKDANLGDLFYIFGYPCEEAAYMLLDAVQKQGEYVKDSGTGKSFKERCGAIDAARLYRLYNDAHDEMDDYER